MGRNISQVKAHHGNLKQQSSNVHQLWEKIIFLAWFYTLEEPGLNRFTLKFTLILTRYSWQSTRNFKFVQWKKSYFISYWTSVYYQSQIAQNNVITIKQLIQTIQLNRNPSKTLPTTIRTIWSVKCCSSRASLEIADKSPTLNLMEIWTYSNYLSELEDISQLIIEP